MKAILEAIEEFRRAIQHEESGGAEAQLLLAAIIDQREADVREGFSARSGCSYGLECEEPERQREELEVAIAEMRREAGGGT